MITSTANQTIKHIRALKGRKARDESGSFFVEGLKIVGEAVQLGADVEALIVAPDLLDKRGGFAAQIVRDAQRRNIPILDVSPPVFESISGKENPQGIGAVVRQHLDSLESVNVNEPCWVALEGTQDPGNIGTILRTCDAVGVGGLILLGSTADPYDPGAARASMGAIFSVRLVRSDAAAFARWKTANRIRVVGTSDKAVTDYQAADYTPPMILLMGSERQGLSPETASVCDLLVSLPMRGRMDSLNLAVATGVMLYAIWSKQTRK
jgi:RNA methyltransferase, TrmH family